jgi:hypothetical protein
MITATGAPDGPAQQRNAPPAAIRRGNLDHDDRLAGTSGSTIARALARVYVYAARAPRRRDTGARHARRRR